MKRSALALPFALVACDAPANVTPPTPPLQTTTGAALLPKTEVAQTAPADAPASSSPIAGTRDGPRRTIRLRDGAIVSLQSWKVDAKQGLSDAACAVSIGAQRIATIGTGDADAYTCGTLIEAGGLPPTETIPRIGLIYQVSSPNATFRTAIVLLGGAEGWTVDPDSIGIYDDAPAARSIAALQKAAR